MSFSANWATQNLIAKFNIVQWHIWRVAKMVRQPTETLRFQCFRRNKIFDIYSNSIVDEMFRCSSKIRLEMVLYSNMKWMNRIAFREHIGSTAHTTMYNIHENPKMALQGEHTKLSEFSTDDEQ